MAKLIGRTFDHRALGIVLVVDKGPKSVKVYFPAEIAEVVVHFGGVCHRKCDQTPMIEERVKREKPHRYFEAGKTS